MDTIDKVIFIVHCEGQGLEAADGQGAVWLYRDGKLLRAFEVHKHDRVNVADYNSWAPKFGCTPIARNYTEWKTV